MLDRIDIQVEAAAVDYKDLSSVKKSETSLQIKQRVIQAQEIQAQRYKNLKVKFNSQLSAAQIEQYCQIDEQGQNILRQAFNSLNLSARAYNKILKVARTIADLDFAQNILPQHIAEAVQYRNLDRKYWN